MNIVIYKGRIIPNTANNTKLYNYYKGEGEKKSLLTMLVSVQKPYAKKDENGYYPSDLFPVKCFGPQADFINTYFKPGDEILLQGYNVVEKGGEKEDGGRYPDRTVMIIEKCEFCGGNSKKEESSKPVSKPATASADEASIFNIQV
jgi:single-stranded DNA-binding protein